MIHIIMETKEPKRTRIRTINYISMRKYYIFRVPLTPTSNKKQIVIAIDLVSFIRFYHSITRMFCILMIALIVDDEIYTYILKLIFVNQKCKLVAVFSIIIE